MRSLEGRILQGIVHPFDIDGRRNETAISIYLGDDSHTKGLIRKIDAALCQVTAEGCGPYGLEM